MSLSFIAFVKTLVLPPILNFIIIAIGVCFKRKKNLSRFFIYTGSLSLLLFCFSPFSNFLFKSLEKYPALLPPVSVNGEQAIVVLGGGIHPIQMEYGKEIVGSTTLQRNHYAAFLYKQVKLPILVTGGLFEPRLYSEAAVMAETLTDSFNVEVTWQEGKSRNTAENAIFSAEILKQNNIDKIFLVTHARHMARAAMMFEQVGMKVTPAPTLFTKDDIKSGWTYFIPSLSALSNTREALHEYIGILWYKIRY